LSSSFESLGLASALVRAVSDEGYIDATPIQVQAIPVILAGRDVLAAAQTGTGKTAAFTLPLLQRLTQPSHPRVQPKCVRVLILAPTRELAAQVEESVRTYGRHMKVSSTLVYGGVGIQPQIEALRRGVDILVATPGRLLDHVGQRTIDLSKVEILVLDEADRMLDMGFIHDIKRVLALLPKARQNLLFSATFSDEIRELARGLLRDPATVEVARRNEASALVTHVIHPVARERKRELLRDLIVDGEWQQVLVFVRMKHVANRLAEQLSKDGLVAAAIHGNKSQGARTRALAGFKDGSVRVLVATDIAARGLDIEQLPHVVNLELPNVPEDYVHRIGRTGRAGSPGHAVSLVSQDELGLLRDIERLMKRTLPRQIVPGFEAGKPGTIEETPTPRPAPSARPAQRMQRKPPEPAPREAQRRDGSHVKASSHERADNAPPHHSSSRQSAGIGRNGTQPAHRNPAPRPADSGRPARPNGGKRGPAQGDARSSNNVVRSNLPPGWPGSTRNR